MQGRYSVCTKSRPLIQEKLADQREGLLPTKIIRPSTFPWFIPIVVIVKKNGVGIRLCIIYRSDKDLSQVMVYSVPLKQNFIELNYSLRYFSLDMTSGFLRCRHDRIKRDEFRLLSPLWDYMYGCGCYLGSRMRLRYSRDCSIFPLCVLTISSSSQSRWIRRSVHDGRTRCKVWPIIIGSTVVHRQHSNFGVVGYVIHEGRAIVSRV